MFSQNRTGLTNKVGAQYATELPFRKLKGSDVRIRVDEQLQKGLHNFGVVFAALLGDVVEFVLRPEQRRRGPEGERGFVTLYFG